MNLLYGSKPQSGRKKNLLHCYNSNELHIQQFWLRNPTWTTVEQTSNNLNRQKSLISNLRITSENTNIQRPSKTVKKAASMVLTKAARKVTTPSTLLSVLLPDAVLLPATQKMVQRTTLNNVRLKNVLKQVTTNVLHSKIFFHAIFF